MKSNLNMLFSLDPHSRLIYGEKMQEYFDDDLYGSFIIVSIWPKNMASGFIVYLVIQSRYPQINSF